MAGECIWFGVTIDKIHALAFRQLLFLLDHLLKRAVAPLGRQEEILAASLGFARVEEKAPQTSSICPSMPGDAMHRADKCAATAADHSITNFSTHDGLIKKTKSCIETGWAVFILAAPRQVNGD